MTDKEFIDEYILSNWVFSPHLSSYYTSNEFFVVTSTDGTLSFAINKFVEFINEIYGEWYCEIEGKYLSDIINEWFENEKSKSLKEINDELANLNVVLGPRSWQCVDEHGDIFFWKKLVVKFRDKYSKTLIKTVYDEWFENKVFEVSEKMMNSPWS